MLFRQRFTQAGILGCIGIFVGPVLYGIGSGMAAERALSRYSTGGGNGILLMAIGAAITLAASICLLIGREYYSARGGDPAAEDMANRPPPRPGEF